MIVNVSPTIPDHAFLHSPTVVNRIPRKAGPQQAFPACSGRHPPVHTRHQVSFSMTRMAPITSLWSSSGVTETVLRTERPRRFTA